jgi:hypothetical protein
MPNEIIIPIVSPVYFFDKARALLPQYHTKLFFDFQARETVKPWQHFGEYFQKWQTNDIIELQVIANAGPIYLHLINAQGAKVRSLQFTAMQQNTSLPTYFIYQASLSLDSIVKGRYSLLIEVGDPTGPAPLKKIESDWMDIAEDWPNTCLIEYSNSFFYGDAIFAAPWSPSIRVEGWFSQAKHQSKDEQFTDQVYNQRMIYSDPFTVLPFVIGPGRGLPEWAPFVLSWILGCDEVYIDGVQFTKADGAKLEEIKEDGIANRGFIIDLQPANRRSSRFFPIDGLPGGKKLLVSLNVETQGFADTTTGNGSNVIQIASVE